MVYSKILELSSLGAGYPYGPVDYDDGADIVANITRKAVSKGPSIPETYAGYDNSVCFVEPMVRALDRPRPVGCYSDWRPAFLCPRAERRTSASTTVPFSAPFAETSSLTFIARRRWPPKARRL